MKRRTEQTHNETTTERRGSTLIIVIALLGMLSFLGIVFFTFASQERSAAGYFSEAAKTTTSEPDDIFNWMLQQIISGPPNQLKGSVLYSQSRRHSLVTNMVGSDIHPYTGAGVNIINEDDPATASTALVARVDQNYNGTANDEDASSGNPNTQLLLDFVDSPAVRNGTENRTVPSPDVDYTYPDINNLFLAYKGWAIRDNGSLATPRYQQVPVIIPSFFRPQYMKTSNGNGRSAVGNPNVPTDANWADAFDGVDRTTGRFAFRSFRPHPDHLAGFTSNGSQVYRFLLDTEATSLGLAGGFPFVPADAATALGNDPNSRGELGIWTGSQPTVYELDVDQRW